MQKTYRQLREELDNLILAMENPELDIDEAQKNFEKATELITQLEKMLLDKKKQLKIIQKKLK